MIVQRIQNNNSYNPNFGLKLDIKPVEGMISSMEILKLQDKARSLGHDNSAAKIIVGKIFSRLEGDNREGGLFHGYNMQAISYHKGELNLENIGPVQANDDLYIGFSNRLQEKFKPFNIIGKWLEKTFGPNNS